MTTLKRILSWWLAYGAIYYVLVLSFMIPPRIAGGYSLPAALFNAANSAFAMVALSLVPAFLILFLWALIVERRPQWERGDRMLLLSSAVLALLIALGAGLLGVNPGFPWRTGSYPGDVVQATVALLAQAWLCVLLARLTVRGFTASAPTPLEPVTP